MTTGVLAAGVLAIAMTGCLPTLPVGQPPSDPVQTPPPPTTPPPSPDTTPSDPPPPTPSTSAPPAGEGPDVGAGATVEELFVGQFDPVTIDDGAGDIWTISPTGVYVITTEESLAQDTAVYALEIQATHDDGGTSFAPTCFTISLDESGTLFEVPTNESDLPNTVVEQREDIVDGYAYVAGPVGLDAATWVFESNYGDETHTFEFQP